MAGGREDGPGDRAAAADAVGEAAAAVTAAGGNVRANLARPTPGVSPGPAPATMMDVARLAGVSQSTVSRVLSGSPSSIPIAQATRERVLAAAAGLGYRPNPLARGLKGSATMLLGVIVRDISDPFFIAAIDAISRLAELQGYNVVLGTAHSRADEAIALRAVLETRHCDAIVLLGDMGDQPRLLEDLRGARVPVVALWQGMASPEVCSVNVDNRHGIGLVIDHLLALGHRRIAFVSGRPLGDIQERQEAFVARAAREALVVPAGYILGVSNDPAGGVAAFAALATLPEPPTAVLCSTDMIAMGMLHEAARRGVRVPHELSVAGFDDLPFSRYMIPSLTTVAMPIGVMATRAVDAAMAAVNAGTSCVAGVHTVTPELVIRHSTARSPTVEGSP